MRFVVFRESLAVAIWYVEASTSDAAIERVFPADPVADGRFLESGGMEDPHLEADIVEVALRAHPLRRFPANVEIATGSHEYRRIGPEGEPPRRRSP